jgi:hypothetical protein
MPMNSDGKPGRNDAQHRGKPSEARPQEGGRAGGQHSRGGQQEQPRQGGSKEELEREKAKRGKGRPA